MRKINKIDWLLIIGLALAPMTGLRIWKIGPGEILCLLWCIRILPIRYVEMNYMSIFFLRFVFALLIGASICYIVSPNELVISDLFTWIFLSCIAVMLYEGLKNNDYQYNELLFYTFSKSATLWYLFIYIYSLYISKYFLSAPLWYAKIRFTGGGTNPHQIAILMCGLLFCFLRKIYHRGGFVNNAIYGSICLFLLLQTLSSTGIMAVFLASSFFSVLCTLKFMPTRKKRIAAVTLEVLIFTYIIILGYQNIINYTYEWIASDSNGLGRLELFSQIIETFKKSPIFGLGPGMHALWGTTPKEFHNTYLEIIAATGIVGTLSFILFTYQLFREASQDLSFLPILIAMYAYGLAGFAMRRLVYWGIIVFILVLAEQRKKLKIGYCFEGEILE